MAASNNGQGRTRKEPPTHEKLLTSFLTYPHWPNMRLEPVQCAKELSDEQITELKESFSRFDKKDDGTISSSDFGAVMKDLGHNPSKTELQEMMKAEGVHGKGTIDFPTFLTMMTKKMGADEEEMFREAFRTFDSDGNGYISTEELRQVLKFLGEMVSDTEVEEIIEAADVDRSGKIKYDQFVAFMSKR